MAVLDAQTGELLGACFGILVAVYLTLPPLLRVPDLAIVVQANDNCLVVNVRIFSKVWGQVYTSLFVWLCVRRAAKDLTAKFAGLGLRSRQGADLVSEPAPAVGGEEPQARVNPLCYDQTRGQLFPESGRDRESPFVIYCMLEFP